MESIDMRGAASTINGPEARPRASLERFSKVNSKFFKEFCLTRTLTGEIVRSAWKVRWNHEIGNVK
jgi:hypothetical protein